MNEKTFRRLFPKVKLSVCPYEIQNFGNSTADISILGQFHVYLQFRGEKYLTTFIVTNADEIATDFQTGKEWNMPDISQHTWKCAYHLTQTTERTTTAFKTKPLNKAVQHTAFYQTLLSAMQNSHQAWKIHQFFQGTSFCKEKRKIWIQVHSQGTTEQVTCTITHQAEPGRVPQNFQQLKMESST